MHFHRRENRKNNKACVFTIEAVCLLFSLHFIPLLSVDPSRADGNPDAQCNQIILRTESDVGFHTRNMRCNLDVFVWGSELEVREFSGFLSLFYLYKTR